MGFRKLSDIDQTKISGYCDFMQNDKAKFDSTECAESVQHLLNGFKKHT